MAQAVIETMALGNGLSVRMETEGYDFDNCATALDPIGPFHLEDVIAAALFTRMNLGKMAKVLNRSRQNLKEHIFSTDGLREWWQDMSEARIDDIEEQQVQGALQGDLGAGRFLLQTLGKGRGFSTRAEVTGEDGSPITTAIVSPAKNLEELFARYSSC